MKINSNFSNLKGGFVFSEIAEKVDEHRKKNPKNPRERLINLSIGDISCPLVPAIIQAITRSAMEMSNVETVRGYEARQGYDFLKEAIKGYYGKKGVTLQNDEIFVGDGIGSDIANVFDLFSNNTTVLIQDPGYPAYADASIMSGRNIGYIKGDISNNFLPMPDEQISADVIYLCSPNNPTGLAYNYAQLKQWVYHAVSHDSIILFDSAYEAFIQEKDLPTSIFQIDGAADCAIEFCSLSKTAGFTGTRCGYTVIPRKLFRDGKSINELWRRRQVTKFNGVAYIVQRGAEAVFLEGWPQVSENIAYYMRNARIITDALRRLGIWFAGGVNSPYIWLKCPNDMLSWDFFDHLLKNRNVAVMPGIGFGENGEGFVRLSSFGKEDEVTEAMERLETEIGHLE